ncbi:MAG: site-2 protease family protein [Coriobacteriaceae bacterium]|nr:site-2 protease family protein [Coriobacteriaceae bacterium]
MDFQYVMSLVVSAVAVVIGIVVHESAHALAAYALGDRTARERGRVSLNPLNHIDPFGTVLLPILMIMAGGPVFAFAKPVPIYLGNLKHPKRDEALVSLAGPLSNIMLAFVAALLVRGIGTNPALLYGFGGSETMRIIVQGLISFMSVNLSLAFFNLIPLPPLDGSALLVPFLKGRALQTYYEIQRYAMPILIVVLYVLPSFLHIDLVGLFFSFTMEPVFSFLLQFAFAL